MTVDIHCKARREDQFMEIYGFNVNEIRHLRARSLLGAAPRRLNLRSSVSKDRGGTPAAARTPNL
jgi:hypothetical protein